MKKWLLISLMLGFLALLVAMSGCATTVMPAGQADGGYYFQYYDGGGSYVWVDRDRYYYVANNQLIYHNHSIDVIVNGCPIGTYVIRDYDHFRQQLADRGNIGRWRYRNRWGVESQPGSNFFHNLFNSSQSGGSKPPSVQISPFRFSRPSASPPEGGHRFNSNGVQRRGHGKAPGAAIKPSDRHIAPSATQPESRKPAASPPARQTPQVQAPTQSPAQHQMAKPPRIAPQRNVAPPRTAPRQIHSRPNVGQNQHPILKKR